MKALSQLSRLGEALLLKSSPRLKDKVNAQDLFHQVAEEETFHFEITSDAILNLCELFIFELRVSGGEDTFQETKSLVQQLVERARHNYSYITFVEALILQAKLAMKGGDLTAASQFLDQAKTTAEDKGLSSLFEKISLEKQLLNQQYKKWQHLIRSNAPFHTRLEQAQLEEYIKDALKIVRFKES